MTDQLNALLKEARACTRCSAHLPVGPRPVLRAAATARLLIVGQAPGRRVHETGVPWNDPSGDRLREWMQLDRAQLQGLLDAAEQARDRSRAAAAGRALFRYLRLCAERSSGDADD